MAVMFMTPYVLIMLSFSGLNTFEVAKERIFDTFLGGMIAFLSSYIIFPNWESFQIKKKCTGIAHCKLQISFSGSSDSIGRRNYGNEL
ncbi:FUSC family protein [Sphingobacterium daejeonense]|uniref:FUSC family protein n=1 Tax=Sphingobacterium daejeonense TaxID=371142 RepID=UPI0010C4639B|nr:integral membrane protein, YccS/YhfK family [Sphingobacterium daejeonense]